MPNQSGITRGCSIAVSGSNVHVAWWQSAQSHISMTTSSDRGATFAAAPCCDWRTFPDPNDPNQCGTRPACTFVMAANPPPLFLNDCGTGTETGRNLITADPSGTVHAIRNWPLPYLAADVLDPNIIYVVADDYSGTNSNILFARSTNGGSSWNSASVLNDDGGTSHQYFPRIATHVTSDSPPKSKLFTIWYDRRRDPNNFHYDVQYRVSVTQGVSWHSSLQLSDNSAPIPLPRTNRACCNQGVCSLINCNSIADCPQDYDECKLPALAPANLCFFGDYNTVVKVPTRPEFFQAIWADSRSVIAGERDSDIRSVGGC